MKKFFKHYRIMIFIMVVLTMLLGPYARKNHIDNNLEENVLHDDHLENYKRFLDNFGNDRMLIAAFSYENIDSELIRNVYRIEKRLMDTGVVEEIVSPVSILKDTFNLENEESLEVWLQSEDQVKTFISRLIKFKSISTTIISIPNKTASLLIKIREEISDTDIDGIEKIIKILDNDEYFKGNIKTTGIPEIIKIIHQYTTHDQKTFTPVTVLIILIILFLLYRSVFGVLIPFLSIIFPLIWAMGIHNLNGNSTNFISSMISPLILGVGLTGSIHMLTTYFEKSRKVKEFDRNILFETMKELLPPVLMCQITTVIGFMTLAANGIGAVKQYGLYSALGLIFSLLTTFVFIPAMIMQTKITAAKFTSFQNAHIFFEKTAKFVLKYKLLIIIVVCIFAITGYMGLSKISIETSLIRFIDEKHELIGKINHIEKNLYGIVPVHVCIETDGDTLENSLLNYELCLKISSLEVELGKIENVDSVVSFVDLVQDYDREFSGEPHHIPPSAEEINEYLDFYRNDEETGENKLLAGFITPDFNRAHIALRIKDISSKKLSEIFKRVEILTEKFLGKKVRFYLTGRAYLWAETSEILIYNEIMNFFLSLILIDAVIIIYFKSMIIGILVLLPNVLPIMFIFGMMGFLGISLNTVTGMLACVAIGMAVDDTIHYLYTFRNKIEVENLDYNSAIVETMKIKGSSMIFTSLVISAGFSVLILSDFMPTVHFGILISCTIFSALVLDLLLTPAVILYLKPFKQKMKKKQNQELATENTEGD